VQPLFEPGAEGVKTEFNTSTTPPANNNTPQPKPDAGKFKID
jgi:hypothetical protein